MATTPTQLIERFYYDVWNKGDEAVAYKILHLDFVFRGSLGPEHHGPDGFVQYLRAVRRSLPDFVCNIQEIVSEDNRAVARMDFVGTHEGEFYGVAPTGRKINWAGAAFFKTDGQQITDLWVLGDIDNVKLQLGVQSGGSFASL